VVIFDYMSGNSVWPVCK